MSCRGAVLGERVRDASERRTALPQRADASPNCLIQNARPPKHYALRHVCIGAPPTPARVTSRLGLRDHYVSKCTFEKSL